MTTQPDLSADLPWDADTLPKASRDIDILLGDFERVGYCIIEKALDPDMLAAVRTRLAEQAAAERAVYEDRNPAHPVPEAQWVNMLLNKGPIFFELIRHPVVVSVLEHALGPDYLISSVDAQIQHPGAATMQLHTDQWWVPPLVQPGERQIRVSDMRRDFGESCDPRPSGTPVAPRMAATAMWMISDFTVETGATRVVPFSHLSGRAPDTGVPHKIPSVATEGPAGTAFVFDARLWHSSWENTSDEPRYGITTAACGPQCRQIENYTRGMRPEAFAACPEDLLPRLGFSEWSSYGHTGDLGTVPTKPGDETIGVMKPDVAD